MARSAWEVFPHAIRWERWMGLFVVLFVAGFAANASSQTQVANPVVAPGGGNYAYLQLVQVSCATAGATIHYALANRPVTESDPVIASGSTIELFTGTYLSVRAFANGMTPSDTVGGSYNLVGSVAAGADHVLAVRADGTVWAAGQNTHGQLGDGTTVSHAVLQAVHGLTGIVTVAAGNQFSLALKNDGSVWTWGANASGQLGNGSTTDSPVPVQILSGHSIIAIAAGAEGSFALAADATGNVWVWGANNHGQLGDGTTTSRNAPYKISGVSTCVSLAAGDSFSFAVKKDGSVAAWGANDHGQLGDGTTTDRSSPVAVQNLANIWSIAGGSQHAVAVDASGSVWTWGANSSGQLGNGSTSGQSTPSFLAGTSVAGTVAAAGNYTFALNTGGTLRGWGDNSWGQIGSSLGSTVTTPQTMTALTNGIAVAGGMAQAIGIQTNENIVIWTNGVVSTVMNAADTDTDGNALPDAWEILYFGYTGVNPSALSPNGDQLTNLQNYQQGINPISSIDTNGLSYSWELQYFGQPNVDPNADPDRDGYSNIYEYTHNTDPTSATSLPTPDIIVDSSGNSPGSYTTIQAALNAVTHDYEIISVLPGTYRESYLYWPNHKIMIRSTAGAASTIIDGGDNSTVLVLQADTVIDGFTIAHGYGYDGEPGGVEVSRGNTALVNCVIRNNYGPAVYSYGSASLINCTVINNTLNGGSAIQTYHGTTTLTNTILWDGGNEIGTDASTGQVTVSATYSDIQGGYSGQGNISSNPTVRNDGHLSAGSSCIGEGTPTGAPARDMDNEARAAAGPIDMGADQYMDSQGSGLPDWWQLMYFGQLGVNPTALSPNGDQLTNLQNYQQQIDPDNVIDSNGIPYAWELQYFGVLHIDPAADADGDGYPNIYEYAHNTDPTSASSVPTPDIIVDPSGNSPGGYTTIQSALYSITHDYEIISVLPGTYSEYLFNSQYKVLLKSSGGAAATILNESASGTIGIYTDAIFNGFTICNAAYGAISISGATGGFVNCLILNNKGDYGSAIGVSEGALNLTNCTFLNNQASASSPVIEASGSSVNIVNTILWDGGKEVQLEDTISTVTAAYSDIQGASVFTGTGNLNADPLLRQDGHIMAASPCIGAGTSAGAPHADMDNEARPPASIDIGADQYIDSEGIGIPDWWQIKYFGAVGVDPNAQSPNGDGLSNLQNYQQENDPIGTLDSSGFPYAWELQYFGHIHVNPNDDADGDGYPNIYEYVHGTDPTSASSVPAPDFIVDQAGPQAGNVYTSISAAIQAVTFDYAIILVHPETYTEAPYIYGHKVLLISSSGAAYTTISGILNSYTGTVNIQSDVVFNGFTFCNNTYGAINVGGANLALVNCVIRNNQGSYGSGIAAYGGSLSLTNCTIFKNQSSASIPVVAVSSETVTMVNTILWDGGNEILLQDASSTISATYSDVQGAAVYPGQGNINANPLLQADGHLMVDSPCIDTGTSAGAPLTDMDLEVRPFGAIFDIGADEWVDTDGQGLPDWWQNKWYEQLGIDPTKLAVNESQLTVLQCYQVDLNPINYIGPIDANGISYLWEVQNFGQVGIDQNGDPDHDDFPNGYEYAHNTDPAAANSKPTPDFIVDPSGSTGYPTIQSAMSALTHDFQIIQVNPGIYAESQLYPSYRVMIRAAGAASAIIDAQGKTGNVFYLVKDAFIEGLTIRNATSSPISINSQNNYAPKVILENCIISGNQSAGAGSAIYDYNGSLSIINSTIVGNTSSNGSSAIYSQGNSAPVSLTNTILWNGGNEIVTAGTPAAATNSDIESSVYYGPGNLNANPQVRSDGHLMQGSPCIGAAFPLLAATWDMDGEARPVGTTGDIGADEYVDTDGNGLPNWWQIEYFGVLGVNPSTVEEGGLTYLQAYQQGIIPTVITTAWETQNFGATGVDPYDDPDRDGFPNIYEFTHQADPNSASAIPAPDIVVDPDGSTGYPTISSALQALTHDYEIIEVHPGIYPENIRVTHKVLIRSTAGAAATIIDGHAGGATVAAYNDIILDGLSIINGSKSGITANDCALRLVNCVVRNNQGTFGSAIAAYDAQVVAINCSFISNSSALFPANPFSAIQTSNGAVSLTNCISWNPNISETAVDAVAGTNAISAIYSDLKGTTAYSGTGNINGDPLMTPDGHLKAGSPCIDTGTSVGAPIRDMDGESRPSGAGYDMGADEYIDTDGSGLPDWWQMKYFGHLGVSPTALAPSGNGNTNLFDYQSGYDPNDFYGGAAPYLSIVGGANQYGPPSTTLPQPLVVWVSPETGGFSSNAPVQVTVPVGEATISASPTGPFTNNLITTALTHLQGSAYAATIYIKTASSNGDLSTIKVAAMSPVAVAQAAVTTTAATANSSLDVPSNLTVSPVSSTSVQLSWTNPSGGSVTGTEVQVSEDGGVTWVTMAMVSAGETTYTVTNLSSEQQAMFRLVSDQGSSGFSLPTSTVSITLSVAPQLVIDSYLSGEKYVYGFGSFAPMAYTNTFVPIYTTYTISASSTGGGFTGALTQVEVMDTNTGSIATTTTQNTGSVYQIYMNGTQVVSNNVELAYTMTVSNINASSSYVLSSGFSWADLINNVGAVLTNTAAPTNSAVGVGAYGYVEEVPYLQYGDKAELEVGLSKMTYHFQVNPSSNPQTVIWAVQFSSEAGTGTTLPPPTTTLMSWTGTGTQTPSYSIDPSSTNGVLGSYTVYPLNAQVRVMHPATGLEPIARQQLEGGYIALDSSVTSNNPAPITSLILYPLSILSNTPNLLFSDTPQYILTWSSSKIHVWKDAARTIPVISGQTTFPIDQASTVYLQGVEKSDQAMDVEIDEQLVAGAQSVQSALVKLTVVQSKYFIISQAFIPPGWVDVPGNWVPGWVPGSSSISGMVAGGDGRTYVNPPVLAQNTYRMAEYLVVTPFQDLNNSAMEYISQPFPADSAYYKKSTSVPIDQQSGTTGTLLVGGATSTYHGRSAVVGPDSSFLYAGDKSVVVFTSMHATDGVATNYPVGTSLAVPSVKWDLAFAFNVSNPVSPTITLTGITTAYPAFEIYAQESSGEFCPLLQQTPADNLTPFDLYFEIQIPNSQPITIP